VELLREAEIRGSDLLLGCAPGDAEATVQVRAGHRADWEATRDILCPEDIMTEILAATCRG
jgi:hypothetical protein